MIATRVVSNMLSVNTPTTRGRVNQSGSSLPLSISISRGGSTTITALQAEDNNYNSALASMTLTVLRNDIYNAQWYSSSIITRTYGIPPFEIIDPIVASDYNGIFNFRSSDPSIASVTSRTVTINSVGTVTLFADISQDENYVAKTVTVTLIVLKANQSIIIDPLPIEKPLKDFTSITVSATSTSGAVSYTHLTLPTKA